MTELVSGMPAPHSGTNLRECEDQNWFKFQAFPVFRFDVRRFRVLREVAAPHVEDHWYRGILFLAATRTTYPAHLKSLVWQF
jgi:hypothetical protein